MDYTSKNKIHPEIINERTKNSNKRKLFPKTTQNIDSNIIKITRTTRKRKSDITDTFKVPKQKREMLADSLCNIKNNKYANDFINCSDDNDISKNSTNKRKLNKQLSSKLTKSKKVNSVATSNTSKISKKQKSSILNTSKVSKNKMKLLDNDLPCNIENIKFSIDDSSDFNKDDMCINKSVNKTDMEFHIWNEADVLSEISDIPKQIANNIIDLINDDNTLPFIARYRKTMINYMSPEKLQEIFESYEDLCTLKKKSIGILKKLKKENKLTHLIEKSIISARNLDELEFLYAPHKESQNKKYKPEMKNSVQLILCGKQILIENLCEPDENIVDVTKNLIQCLADTIYKDSEVLDFVKNLKNEKYILIECNKGRKTKDANIDKYSSKDVEKEKFDKYIGFKINADFIKPHQILAINRGEAIKALSVKVVIPELVSKKFFRFCSSKWKESVFINDAIDNAYKRFVCPFISRHIRSDMTSRAIKESISIFCSNLKRLLLTSPVKGYNILAIDPGFKAGCKIGIIGKLGEPLEMFCIYPRFNSNNDLEAIKLNSYIHKYSCELIALGNGTACRETEKWLDNNKLLGNRQLIIVPEQGASVYSCSSEASKEFPGVDPNLISAISLARRVMDPLSELVKVNPKHLGVGMYQHDVPIKLLNDALHNTVVNCVSFVGVDLNTASHFLLMKIAGLTEKKATEIIKYREKINGFKSRDELLKVSGVGPKTYKQCIGFLRIPSSRIPFDNTWIHPENYDLAHEYCDKININISNINCEKFVTDFKEKLFSINLKQLSSILNCTESDLEIINEALQQPPSIDPLRNIKPIYSSGFDHKSIPDVGAVFTGAVRNVTSFGIFVDCGFGKDAMIHISKIGNSVIPQLGDRVTVTVIPSFSDDKISLRLIKINT